jgi:hypothetical protein
MIEVLMEFVGLEVPGGNEYKVEVPRPPAQGEVVIGPDDFGRWTVDMIEFTYADGFAFEPEVRVILRRYP